MRAVPHCHIAFAGPSALSAMLPSQGRQLPSGRMDATLRKLLLATALLYFGSPAAAVKITIPAGRTECVSESVTNEHFSVGRVRRSTKEAFCGPQFSDMVASGCTVHGAGGDSSYPCYQPVTARTLPAPQMPGGPRIDGRVLVTGNSQYYVPFVTVRVSTFAASRACTAPAELLVACAVGTPCAYGCAHV